MYGYQIDALCSPLNAASVIVITKHASMQSTDLKVINENVGIRSPMSLAK